MIWEIGADGVVRPGKDILSELTLCLYSRLMPNLLSNYFEVSSPAPREGLHL